MKEYHATIIDEASGKPISRIEFLATTDEEAVEIIHKVAAALEWSGNIQFIYHHHKESNLYK